MGQSFGMVDAPRLHRVIIDLFELCDRFRIVALIHVDDSQGIRGTKRVRMVLAVDVLTSLQ